MSKVAMLNVAGRATAVMCVLAGVLGSPRGARADDTPPGATPARPTSTSNNPPAADPLVITRMVPRAPAPGDDVVTVPSHGSAFVLFPANVTVNNRADVDSVVAPIAMRNWLFLRPAHGAKLGDTITLELTANGYASTSVPVRIRSGADDGSNPYVILPRSEADAAEQQIQERIAAASVEIRAEYERDAERRDHDARRKAMMQTITRLNHGRYFPRGVTKLDRESPLLMVVGGGHWIEEQLVLPVSIATIGDRPFRVEDLVVTGSDGVSYQPEFEFYDQSDAGDGWFSTINLERSVDVAIALRPPTDGGPMAPFTIELLGPDGKRVQGVRVKGITRPEDRKTLPWVELAEAEKRREALERERVRLEREARDREEAERRREAEARRVSLHVVASYGAIWLPSGIDGADRVEPTSLTGFGLRVTKGLTTLWAFEAEIAGATSGTATFRNVTGMGDDLTRSAKLLRAQAGGMIRFGDALVPHVRMSFGLQMVSEDSAFLTMSGSMDGPVSGVEFTETLTFGAGLDWRLSDQVITGIGATVMTPRDQELFRRTIEAGVHLSYMWKP